jgi:pilus assembly protein Flp/PilA
MPGRSSIKIWDWSLKLELRARIVARGHLLARDTYAWLARRLQRDDGQGIVEYALILALLAILVIVALKFTQPQVSTTLNKVSNNL